jgi:hypothetical protein
MSDKKRSDLSRYMKNYSRALDRAKKDYELKREKLLKDLSESYKNIKPIIIDWSPILDEFGKLNEIAAQVFNLPSNGDLNIKFVAIDGTTRKEAFDRFVLFFAGACAIEGELSISDKKVRAKRWNINFEKSLMAYAPIPLSELDDSDPDAFLYHSDKEKIERSSLNLTLMQLAEVYLAYKVAKKGEAKLILLDNSLSGTFMSNDVLYKLFEKNSSPEAYFSLIGAKIGDNEKLNLEDIATAYAAPFSKELDLYPCKEFRREFAFISALYLKDKDKFSECLSKFDTSKFTDLGKILKLEELLSPLKEASKEVHQRWEKVKTAFEKICSNIFEHKKENGLKVETEKGEKWLKEDDIRFLISVGIRLLIEEAWKNNILVVGVVKDSASKLFFKNYLGILKHLNYLSYTPPKFNATDRQILEEIPLIDEKLNSPWSTPEFDAVFSSLHLEKEKCNEKEEKICVKGFRGLITVPPERLFLKQIAQFYLKNGLGNKKVTGHVLFLDRLVLPEEKEINESYIGTLKIQVKRRCCGDRYDDEVRPLYYARHNKVQFLVIYLLDALVRNVYPEVIGYPDPLHEADWCAKSLGKLIEPLIESGKLKFLKDPLIQTIRQTRGNFKRT